MNPTTSTERPHEKSGLMVKIIIKFMVFILVMPVILFFPAGRFDWGMAWIYLGLSMVGTMSNTLLLLRNNPDLLIERSQINKEAKIWDQVLVRLIGLGPLVMLIVAGLDKRSGWSPQMPLGVQIVALLVATAGYLLSSWSMMSNRFFSTVVRIQKDRNHTVISAGPYRFIRHPGYAGGIIFFLTTPLILSSLWTFIPAGLTTCVTIVRTFLEDKTLQNELDGYGDYTNQVRYRLLPGVW
jgi:protein-S-isoprenylcysteine O-methyltransferase Ste14